MKLRLLSIFLFLCLLLSACGSGKPASAGPQHEHKPSMDVKLDIAGHTATVTVTTDLHISAAHYGQARVGGEGHIHMYLDGGEKIGVKTNQKVFDNLQPGPHTLKVSLHNNDHTPYDVTKVINFDIK